MKIGIIGRGVTGKAMSKWLNENTNHTIIEHDPPQGVHGPIEFADVAFICVPVPTLSDGSQDYSNIEEYEYLKCPVFIRSTVLPQFARHYCKGSIHHLPEFLTERTSHEDFANQDLVCSKRAVEILSEVFPGKNMVIQENDHDCALVKYAHNCFGAMKVNFFNHIYNMTLDYDKVRDGILSTGYINSNHTMVPGPDEKFGYGGKCFLKDMYAFAMSTGIDSFKSTVGENSYFRKHEIKE